MINNKWGAASLGVIVALGMLAPAWAGDLADQAIGVWLREKKGWQVEFKLCGDKLCGEIISGEGVDKKTGAPVVGIQMLYDLEKVSEDKWKGKMYNPGDGGTYAGSVTVLNENLIKMSGCMAKILCRSEKWPRVGSTETGDSEDMAPEAGEDMTDEPSEN